MSGIDIKNLSANSFLLFDGAMGTMVQKYGLDAGEIPEIYNMVHPEIISKIHREYISAGADVITTNTFGANEYKLKSTGYSVEDMVGRAVSIAKGSAGAKLVALSMGPTGRLMEPWGDMAYDEAYSMYKRQVSAGVSSGADIIIVETMYDLNEAKAAVSAAKENCSLPVFCTMTFQSSGRTIMGTCPEEFVNTMYDLGVDALGANCSLGPREMVPVVEEILKYAKVPVIAQPNAGLPRLDGDRVLYDVTKQEFVKFILKMKKSGVTIFGGCCGTGPEFIMETRRALMGCDERQH